MKKLLLLLPMLLLIMGCEDDAEDPTISEILTGTWTVTNMGEYANSDCSGDLDYNYWALAVAIGTNVEFVFNSDGTVDMVSTIFGETISETSDWSADENEICLDGECADYTLSDDGNTITFSESTEAACANLDGDEVALDETACDEAGFDWFDASCAEFTLTKD